MENLRNEFHNLSYHKQLKDMGYIYLFIYLLTKWLLRLFVNTGKFISYAIFIIYPLSVQLLRLVIPLSLSKPLQVLGVRKSHSFLCINSETLHVGKWGSSQERQMRFLCGGQLCGSCAKLDTTEDQTEKYATMSNCMNHTS